MRKLSANSDLRWCWLAFFLGIVISIPNLAQIREGQK